MALQSRPVVSLTDTVVVLGRFPALAGVHLEVQRGEIVALAGANGAGKTTLLRLCAGLLGIASGEGEVLGHDLSDPVERRGLRRRVGLLGPGSGALYEELTAIENVRFWARTVGVDAADADAALDAVGLVGRPAATAVAKLSTGQRRRAALAALVARRPELWLLDEPHAGLDSDGRDVLDGLLRRAADAGATVMLASHEHDRAAAVADRRVTMAGGRIVAAPSAQTMSGVTGVSRVP